MVCSKRVTITGGWGYGNLGDDAILTATLGLVSSIQPVELTVLTYEPEARLVHSYPEVQFEYSLHRSADRGISDGLFKAIDSPLSFRRWVSCRIADRVNQKLKGRLLRSSDEDLIRFQSTFDRCDLFVVGGGGYLNEGWFSKSDSIFDEVYAALKKGVNFVVAGPTLGKFSDRRLSGKVYGLLSEAKAIWVRDEFSYDDLVKKGIKSEIIADIALSDYSYSEIDRSGFEVAVIVNKINVSFIEMLVSALKEIQGRGQCGRVVVLLSRLWEGDLKAARFMLGVARRAGLHVSVFIPGDVFELEDRIKRCSLMVSENLHGLIIAARNGVSVVSINDYPVGRANHRKFVAFMSQIKSDDFSIDSKCSSETISEVIGARIGSSSQAAVDSLSLCQDVRARGSAFFSSALNSDS